MKKLSAVSAAVVGITVGMASGVVSASESETHFPGGCEVHQAAEISSVEVAALAEKDYHDILSQFDVENTDGLQFSGCGGVI